MTTKDIFKLNSEVSNFMNSDMGYIRECYGNDCTAQNVLDYYVASAEAEDSNSPSYMILNDEQKAHFLHVAEVIIRDGFYPHA